MEYKIAGLEFKPNVLQIRWKHSMCVEKITTNKGVWIMYSTYLHSNNALLSVNNSINLQIYQSA